MPHIAFETLHGAQKNAQMVKTLGRRAKMTACLRPVLTSGAFFLLSLAVCFRIPSPYALAALAVLAVSGAPLLWPCVGVAVGVLFRALWGINMDAWQLLGCAFIISVGRSMKKTLLHTALLTVAALVPRLIFAVASGALADEILLAGLSILLGVVALPALLQLMEQQERQETETSQDHFLCQLFPLLIMMMGAARLMFSALNFGFATAAFCVLLVSGMLGSGAGICAGLLCGLPLTLSGHSAGMMLCLAFCGMVSGLFKQKRRFICALVFMLTTPIAQYVSFGMISTSVLVSCGCAALMYLVLPRRVIDLLCQKLWCLLNRSAKESAFLQTELNRLSGALSRISDALPEIEEPVLDVRDEAERIAASLCIGCDRMPQCFHEQYAKTIDLMQRLAASGGYETVYHKIIQEGFLDCPRAENIPPLLEELVQRTSLAQQQAARAQNEREMLKTHLSAISHQVMRIRKRVQGADWSRDGMETQVEDILRLMRLPAKVLWAQSLDGQISIALSGETPFSMKPPSDQLLHLLENKFGVPLYFSIVEGTRLLIRQMPPVKLLSGFASITSAQSPATAAEPPENGDAFLLREVSNGQLVIALSDGMGHGTQARRESKKTLEMLALCLSAGYSREQAMKAVNGMMLASAQEERYATVDLCLLDCWNGKMIMNKLGACPSLLIQGRRIQKIEGQTLPLGILSNVIAMEHVFQMDDQDLLLLMTDGITDAFGSDEALQNVIYRVLNEPPQIIADTLLQEALAVVDHRPKDDMSILCLRTVENEAARLPRRRAAG